VYQPFPKFIKELKSYMIRSNVKFLSDFIWSLLWIKAIDSEDPLSRVVQICLHVIVNKIARRIQKLCSYV